MAEYATLLADSVLRHKAWLAEHTAQIETDLANKIKSEFIANMSHELRTPLNTVIGFAKLLSEHNKRPLKDTEVVEYGDLIRAAASHLLAVINDILDISKMQSGKLALDAREVELEEILQVAVASFQSSAAEAGVTLECRLDPVLPAVKGDPAKLRQVFANLISNAVKFTPRGGTATLEAGTGAGGAASVRVRDTGVGMTAEEIAVALTPFGQVDATRSRWREGTGLGLPIARALVQLHGGHLDIRSTKSQGTEVTVVLPAGADISDMHGRQAPRDAGTGIHGTGIHGHGSL